MQYELLTDLGGWLWWGIVKKCKTDLTEEQMKKYWSRNLFFLAVIFFIGAFIFLKVVPFLSAFLHD